MKDYFDYKKPALWITAGLAAASLVPAVLLLLKKPKRLLRSLMGQALAVGEIVYQAPFYDLTCTLASAPLYRLEPGMGLWVKASDRGGPGPSEWTFLGTLTDLKLEEGNFDNRFYTGKEALFCDLRKKNRRAWQLDLVDDDKGAFYYLLQQKRGQLYLAYGYRTDGLKSPDSLASIIRWLFLLLPLDPG